MFVQQQNEHFVLTAKPSSLPLPPPAGFCLQIPLPQQPQTTAGNNATIYQVNTTHSNDGSKVSPSCGRLNSLHLMRAPAGAISAFPHTAHTKTEPRLFHLPPPHCCWSCWPRMLHWGWESAAESPGPWSVGCSLGGQQQRRRGEGRGGGCGKMRR